jgi:hypothetical protein
VVVDPAVQPISLKIKNAGGGGDGEIDEEGGLLDAAADDGEGEKEARWWKSRLPFLSLCIDAVFFSD